MQIKQEVTMKTLVLALQKAGLSDRCDALVDKFIDSDIEKPVLLEAVPKLLRGAGVPSMKALAICDSLRPTTQLIICDAVCFGLICLLVLFGVAIFH